MSTNGDHGAAAMTRIGEPVVRQPSFADMSSAQRSASMDATVKQVQALTSQVIAVTQVTDSQLSREREYNQLTVEIRGKVSDMELRFACIDTSFKARLRWLFTGKW